jgi:hypothetical protein
LQQGHPTYARIDSGYLIDKQTPEEWPDHATLADPTDSSLSKVSSNEISQAYTPLGAKNA